MSREQMEEQYVSDRIGSENWVTLCNSLDVSIDTHREEVKILLQHDAEQLNYDDLVSYTR